MLNKPSIETSLVTISDNPAIGVLPPGPISNDDLIEGEDSIPSELRINIHYKAVSARVWFILHQAYQGGPVLCRESIDIYSKELVPPFFNPKSLTALLTHRAENKQSTMRQFLRQQIDFNFM